MTRIGLISDTHGLLRPEALVALQGCQRIVHGGDIGGAAILEALCALAPVTAVRGNNDRDAWAAHLPETATVTCEGVRMFVVHDRNALAFDPGAGGIGVVVSGHSHRPLVETREGVLHVNPGSAGPRRFRLPVTLALLDIDGRRAGATLVRLLQD